MSSILELKDQLLILIPIIKDHYLTKENEHYMIDSNGRILQTGPSSLSKNYLLPKPYPHFDECKKFQFFIIAMNVSHCLICDHLQIRSSIIKDGSLLLNDNMEHCSEMYNLKKFVLCIAKDFHYKFVESIILLQGLISQIKMYTKSHFD